MKRMRILCVLCLFLMLVFFCFSQPALAGLSMEPVEDCGTLNPDEPQPAEGEINMALAAGAKITPAFICARVAGAMDARNVALLSVAVSPKKAAAITRRLDREFVADVTMYLDPVKSIPIINQCPDDLVADVVKILLKRNYAGITGRIADNLTAEKMVAVSENLSLDEYIQVGCHMIQTHLIAGILAEKSDNFLIDLVGECTERGYYKLVALVVQEMDSRRVIGLLDRLSMSHPERALFISFLTPYLDPAKSVGIILQCPDDTIAAVVQTLIEQDKADIAGRLADALNQDKLTAVSKRLSPAVITQVGNHMADKKLIVGVLSAYSDEDLLVVFREAARLRYGTLIGGVLGATEPARIKRIVEKLSRDDIIGLLSGLDGPSINMIVQSMTPDERESFAATLASRELAAIVGASSPELINTLWPYFSDDTIMACLPLVDLQILPGMWNDLNSTVRDSLIGMGNRYEPLAIAVQNLPLKPRP